MEILILDVSNVVFKSKLRTAHNRKYVFSSLSAKRICVQDYNSSNNIGILIKDLCLLCSTKVFVSSMFFNNFPDPFPNFLHAAKYRRIIEAGAALSSRHDSYLCRPHVPPFPINISPQWTPRVPLAGVHPAQEPVL